MKVKSESEVTQSCPTLSDPMECSLPGSFIHGIFQARVLEWDAIAFSIKGLGVVHKAEIDVFLELSSFSNDPADIDNLISGSSAFFKSCLNIWIFTVHVLLKPGLEKFEHHFVSL